MSNIGFHINNGVLLGPPEVITLNHRLVTPARN